MIKISIVEHSYLHLVFQCENVNSHFVHFSELNPLPKCTLLRVFFFFFGFGLNNLATDCYKLA